MSSGIQVLIGVVVGVFIASNSPETAEHIRTITLSVLFQIQGVIL